MSNIFTLLNKPDDLWTESDVAFFHAEIVCFVAILNSILFLVLMINEYVRDREIISLHRNVDEQLRAMQDQMNAMAKLLEDATRNDISGDLLL
ncbi:hypothetical protein ACN47E_010211 [Coniothyrium glycines]